MNIHTTTRQIRSANSSEEAEAILREYSKDILRRSLSPSISQTHIEILPQDIEMPLDERRGAKAASAEILEMLKTRPRSNTELARITKRYGARIHDLRQAGFNIKTHHDGRHKYIYELKIGE